ncbi:hypothetical protein TNCV_4807451 [Trichonephila clavipes]|nr:hypothetical protein TNCV_4807451 [Trichonephila clavipes]
MPAMVGYLNHWATAAPRCSSNFPLKAVFGKSIIESLVHNRLRRMSTIGKGCEEVIPPARIAELRRLGKIVSTTHTKPTKLESHVSERLMNFVVENEELSDSYRRS